MMTIVADQTLGADAANIDFTSLPGGYKILILYTSLRCANNAEEVSVQVRFNNDSGTNYENQMLYGVGAVTGALELVTQTGTEYTQVGDWTGTNNPGSATFSCGRVEIPFYANTDRYKVALVDQGRRQTTITGGMRTIDTTVTWRNTAAINRITIAPSSGNLKAGSSAFIVGIN